MHKNTNQQLMTSWRWWMVVLLFVATTVNYMDRQDAGVVAALQNRFCFFQIVQNADLLTWCLRAHPGDGPREWRVGSVIHSKTPGCGFWPAHGRNLP